MSRPAEQQQRLKDARFDCITKITSEPYPQEGRYCNRTWDNIMCWTDTPAGVVARQPCPSYISGFDATGQHNMCDISGDCCRYLAKLPGISLAYIHGHLAWFATRTCMPDGTWFLNPEYNGTWTNYTLCREKRIHVNPETVPVLVVQHMPNIRLLSNIGYGISLGSLILAVIIMLLCRRLRSKSNVLHVNLFLAFILRAAMCFIRETLLVEGLGLPSDVKRLPNGRLAFIPNGTHWECKLLFSVFHYSLGASYMWIFAEGIYLHMLVYKTLWTERHGVRPYILFGWVTPLLFVSPWVVVRLLLDDTLCWNIHAVPNYYWIMKGPIVFSIVTNFAVFVNIVRILTIRASRRQDDNRYRKLAKFTLVLIPLFGVIYILFVAFPPQLPQETEIPYLYAEMFINSFQGFLLALLFCFLNEEVHMELKKLWARHKMRRRDSYLITRSWVFSSTAHASNRRKGSSRHGHSINSSVNQHSLIEVKDDKAITHKTSKLDGGDFQEYEMKKVCNGKSDKGKRKVYSFSRRESESNRSEQVIQSHHSDRSQSDDKTKPEAV